LNASDLEGKVVAVFGAGGDTHRGVAMAIAAAGADVVVGGYAADLAAEAALHSIANEVWATGRRSTVVTFAPDDSVSYAEALSKARDELGRLDLVLRCESVLEA
jgi:NAD(P)-dependent dehydrogenase (short-subunit alcohol dehydrogenase family)